MKNVFKRIASAIVNERRYAAAATQHEPEDPHAFEAGIRSFAYDAHMKNPHVEGTAMHRSWRMGFAEARRRYMTW